MKKFQWPLIWRNKADAQHAEAVQRAINDERRYKREAADKENEWREKWKPVLDKMVKLSATRRDQLGSFILHTELDRYLLEQAATYNDPAIWRYLAGMIGHQVEREISTINFAGLHRLADELEERHRRGSRMSIGPQF